MQIIKRTETNNFTIPDRATLYKTISTESDEYQGNFQVSVNSDNRMVLRIAKDTEEVLVCLTPKESHMLKNFLDLKDLPF